MFFPPLHLHCLKWLWSFRLKWYKCVLKTIRNHLYLYAGSKSVPLWFDCEKWPTPVSVFKLFWNKNRQTNILSNAYLLQQQHPRTPSPPLCLPRFSLSLFSCSSGSCHFSSCCYTASQQSPNYQKPLPAPRQARSHLVSSPLTTHLCPQTECSQA